MCMCCLWDTVAGQSSDISSIVICLSRRKRKSVPSVCSLAFQCTQLCVSVKALLFRGTSSPPALGKHQAHFASITPSLLHTGMLPVRYKAPWGFGTHGLPCSFLVASSCYTSELLWWEPVFEILRSGYGLCLRLIKRRRGKQREVVLKAETFSLKQQTGKGERSMLKFIEGKRNIWKWV